jgi:hypothetical protein
MNSMSGRVAQARVVDWLSVSDPIEFDADYHAVADWYGVPERCRVDLFDCTHDAVLDGTDASAWRPSRSSTGDLDEFKRWIGLPDTYIRSGKVRAQCCDAPIFYNQRLGDPRAELSDAEIRALHLAAGSYLFGDSAACAKYRRAIELRMAPFEIAVYAVRRLILRPGATLTVTGLPAVVLAERIEIHPGSVLKTCTVSRILSDEFVKTEL